MSGEKKISEEEKMYEEKKVTDPFLAGFYESMAKTNTENITKEIMADLFEDSDDSDDFDVESGDEDSKDRPWWPRHTIFGKSTIKQSQIDAMKGRYFHDMYIVRVGGDSTALAPEENEVVVYRSFMKAGLRFPLSKFMVEVLKIFQIFLHQITPEAIIRMGMFVWAVRSQGLEPSAKFFCNMHELLYETKATGKEQYHNNFGCYGFIARPNASYLVPTFRKRWPGAWMEEWFYVKNNLIEREDIKEIIQRPIWSRFGLRRPRVTIENDVEASQKAFSNVCAFIGTRDIVQEHIAYRVWPLVNNWEMPRETAVGSIEGGLVRLKYTFRFRDRFDEPNDDWLKSIDATSDELPGAYTKAEDNALSSAFGGRSKKRLNRVFDAIGFVYPDYCYPSQKQGKKKKAATSAIIAVPKGKKIKVLTHQPRYIEIAILPKICEETYSAAEAKQAAPATRSAEESTIVPKVSIVDLVEAKDDTTKKPELEKATELPEILSQLVEAELPKVAKAPATTPKRRRIASVLDTIVETTRALTPPVKKVAEAETEAGPSAPAETKLATTEQKAEEESLDISVALEKNVGEEAKSPALEAPSEELDYIIRHASGKRLSEEEVFEAKHYARELKYPKGALVFNGTDEDDFMYCLPDNKELSVYREMAKSMGFLKLEAGLCAMTKANLADSLAYNSLKVRK
jgi:hypothetical protein